MNSYHLGLSTRHYEEVFNNEQDASLARGLEVQHA